MNATQDVRIVVYVKTMTYSSQMKCTSLILYVSVTSKAYVKLINLVTMVTSSLKMIFLNHA